MGTEICRVCDNQESISTRKIISSGDSGYLIITCPNCIEYEISSFDKDRIFNRFKLNEIQKKQLSKYLRHHAEHGKRKEINEELILRAVRFPGRPFDLDL